jgi:hypothetical protein
MPTHCNKDSLDFGSVGGRAIIAGFDGRTITSDAGALLLGATDKAIGLIGRFYEDIYCQRGEAENRIKETMSDLFGDRTPTTTMRANQLRLWFSAMAYVLMCALRRIALAGTALARATCATNRLRLLKIGAQVTVSVRRVKIALASSCPYQDLFATAHERLITAAR